MDRSPHFILVLVLLVLQIHIVEHVECGGGYQSFLLSLEGHAHAVALPVLFFQFYLVAHCSEGSVGYYTYPVAEGIGLLHYMGRQEEGSLLLTFHQHLPDLSSVVWIETCGRLVQKYQLWVAHQTDCY